MQKFWDFVINMGSSDRMTQQEKAQISFFNLICIINVLILLALSIFYLFSQLYLIVLLLLWQIFVCVICLYSTANLRFVFAYRFLGLNSILGTILAVYILGESGNFEILFILYFLILSIFSQSQKETFLWLLACSLAIASSFVLYEFFTPLVKYPNSLSIKLPNLIFFLGLICLHTLFYRKDFIRNQTLLQENEDKYQRESAKRKKYSREFQLAQIELKEKEEKYQLLFEYASDGIMLVDILQLKVILMNDSFSRILNRDREELMELSISQIIDNYFPEVENKKQRLLGWQKRLSAGESLEEKIHIQAEYGENYHLQASAIPVPNSHNHLLAIFIRDLSQEVQEEERMKRTLAELEEVNEELKNFAYIVSHDLKAPLRAIGSLADWLVEDHQEELNQEGQEIVHLLNARVERMHNLLEGVLAYSRVSRDKEEKVNIDIELLIEQVVDS
ncbi:MAG: PAS domain-containing protein, partial [Bacteroidota bacterium]